MSLDSKPPTGRNSTAVQPIQRMYWVCLESMPKLSDEQLSIYKAYNQAIGDTAGTADIPMVFHRRNGNPWIVVMGIEDWARIYKKYIDDRE